MLETLRKKGRKAIIIRIIIALVIVAGCLAYSGKGLLQFLQGPVSLNNADDFSKYEGKYVSYDVKLMLGTYIQKTSTNTKTHVTRTTGLGFIVLDPTLETLFGYEKDTSNENLYYDFMNASIDALNGDGEMPEGFQIKGTLKPLKGTELSYFQTVMKDLGDDTDEYMVPYYIDDSTYDGKDEFYIFAVSVVALIALLYLVYNLMKLKNNGCLKQFNKYLESNPTINISAIESDFNAAEHVENIWVGKRWLIYMEGSNVKILGLDQLVWAYYYRRTGRHPESKIITYDINKNRVAFDISGANSDIVLHNWSMNQPHMLLGYDDDLQRTFNKDFTTFLNLKYNPAKAQQQDSADSFFYNDEYAQTSESTNSDQF